MTANKLIFLNIIATYGRSLYALAFGLFTARWALQALGEVDYGLMDISARYWIFRIFLPLAIVAAISGGIGLLPRLWLASSFWRICVSGLLIEAVLLPLAWLFLLDAEERNIVKAKITQLAKKFKGRAS